MKWLATVCVLFLGLLSACAAPPDSEQQAVAPGGYAPGSYRFVSFRGIATEEGYWRQDLARVQLGWFVGDLKECLVQEIVKGSSPALRDAVRRFVAEQTEENYRDFPLKAEWFAPYGKAMSFDGFLDMTYHFCAHLHPPMAQQAES